jgi:hypothetical protein
MAIIWQHYHWLELKEFSQQTTTNFIASELKTGYFTHHVLNYFVSSPIASAYTPPFLIIHSISYNNMVALDSTVDYEYKKKTPR